jgi:hypothetical protein
VGAPEPQVSQLCRARRPLDALPKAAVQAGLEEVLPLAFVPEHLLDPKSELWAPEPQAVQPELQDESESVEVRSEEAHSAQVLP